MGLAGQTFRAARNPRRTLEQGRLALDLLRTGARDGPVLRPISAPPEAPRLLVVSLSEWPFQLKLEAFLAKALEQQGIEPVFATLKGGRWAERYLRTLGIERFVHLEDYPTDDVADEIESAFREIMAQEITVQQLKRVSFRDADVGVHALSTLSRAFKQGRLSLDAPDVRQTLERMLRLSMHSVVAAERMLDDVQPEVVSFLEKGYGLGPVYDAALARGLNPIQYVHAGTHWRDALMLKRYTLATRRMHPASLSDETWAGLRDLPWTDERERALQREFDIRYGEGERHPDAGLQEGKRLMPVEDVRARLDLQPGRRLAVIFSHVLWDANLFYGEDLFEEMETWLVETVRAACANDAVDWIVKVHPANLVKADLGTDLSELIAIRERVGPLPSHVRLLMPDTDINTFSLFQVADWGLTIRGTIGLELPCFGVPVFTAGTGRYSGRGLTIDSATVAEYLDHLARIQDVPPLDEATVLLAKRHAYGLFCLRACRFTSFESIYRSPQDMRTAVGPKLELRVPDAEAFGRAPDLTGYARWATDPSCLDFLDFGQDPQAATEAVQC